MTFYAWGSSDAASSYITLGDTTYFFVDPTNRGVDILQVDPETCNPIGVNSFDTHSNSNAGTALANCLNSLPAGVLLIGVRAYFVQQFSLYLICIVLSSGDLSWPMSRKQNAKVRPSIER